MAEAGTVRWFLATKRLERDIYQVVKTNECGNVVRAETRLVARQ